MANDNLYLDIHVIQTLPPSCVNRDDTGSPKTAFYGGVNRARVSSQSWKNAIREMFKLSVTDNNEKSMSEARQDMASSSSKSRLGIRTKRIVFLLKKELELLGSTDPEQDAMKVLKKAIPKSSKDEKKLLEMAEIPGCAEKTKEWMNSALFFISQQQLKGLAKLVMENPEYTKKEAASVLRQAGTLDMHLFGRMVAQNAELNIDACAQVAHAISTHAVINEYDFFTAIDDAAEKSHAGASMLSTIEYNSSTLYRYATVAVHQLQKQLGEDTPDALRIFVDAFIRSMPTGRQNSFANRTLPSAVLITLRRDQPINFVGAFEKPIAATDEGYVSASERALVKHAQNTYKTWLPEPELSIVVGEGLGSLASPTALQDACDKVRSYVLENL
ncbi:MAG: type I-E CRISPR-associated protein Cas7/Cse4/CasC [Bradymonadia bacterium]|jgi:CRISPR system Cascade subunit CasC